MNSEERFYEKLVNVGTEISKKWFAQHGIGKEKGLSHMFTTRNSLFHYTTISGLMGIVENNCFWLTNLKYMNDLSEQKFAYEVIKRSLERLGNDENYSRQFRDILGKASLTNIKKIDRYAACFTDDGDSLPMWCMYGKESGVSIELNLESDFHFTIGPNCFFEDIIYDDNILEWYVKMVVDLYYDIYKDFVGESMVNHRHIENIMSMELANKSLAYADNFKNKRFSHESETRLLYTWKEDRKINHRVKNNLIVPYVEMPPEDLNKGKLLPIVSITVGPEEEQELVKNSVEDFMKYRGYDVEVKLSSIPYRAR